MSDKEPPEAMEVGLESLVKRVEEQTVRVEEVLKKHSLHAPKMISTILEECRDLEVSPEHFEKAVRILAEYMKNASIYKKRRLGARISKLDIVPRIMICRELLSLGIENFPFDLCMSKMEWDPRVPAEQVTRFQKPKSFIAMAFGDNSFGKLGIGSDVDRVDVLTPVILPGKIVNVHMSESHSIFVLSNGDVYGAGKAANFMEGAQDSKENYATPVPIPYSRSDTSNGFPQIVVSDNNTMIIDYTDYSCLVFGELDTSGNKTILAEGENWKVIKKDHTFSATTIERDRATRNVLVDARNGTRQEVTVKEDGSWLSNPDVKSDIAFLVDGFRVSSEKFWMKYHLTREGEIIAVADDNLYKGRLMSAPRGSENSADDDSDEEDTESLFGTQLLQKDNVILAVMEETALPIGFEEIQCTFSGSSYILYNKWDMDKEVFSEKLPRYRPYAMYGDFQLNPDFDFSSSYFGPRVLSIFNTLKQKLNVKEVTEWFPSWGLPQVVKEIRILMTLEHFLQIDEKTGVTKAFVENVTDQNKLDEPGVLRAMAAAYRMGNMIPMLVVEAGWSIQELADRKQQVWKKGRDMVCGLLGRVEYLLEKLNNVPMKYRKNRLDGRFGSYVAYIIQADPLTVDEFDYDAGVKRCCNPPNGDFNRNHYTTAIQQRVASHDIDGEEVRWKAIRVEALPVEHTKYDHLAYTRFNIQTTRFHIQCIDPELLNHINDHHVLNLNMVCLHDASPDRYVGYLDSFFLISDEDLHLRNVERKIDVISATKSLPTNEQYTVVTSDEQTLQVPKVLFEIFSPFDAGRKRTSSMTGDNVDTFKMSQCTAETLKLLLACLIDVRVFYRASMELKIQVYQASQYYIFEHLHTEMLRMIVQTAEEQDHGYISDLIDKSLDGTILQLIATHRPDMLIFWKNIPIRDNYLKVLYDFRISKLIEEKHYKKVTEVADPPMLPIIASMDWNVDKEKVRHKFMKKLISNHEQDEDVNIDLVKTILAWDPDSPNNRKRPWPFGPVPVWPH